MNNLLVILCHLLPETVAFSKSFLYESQKQKHSKNCKVPQSTGYNLLKRQFYAGQDKWIAVVHESSATCEKAERNR